MSNARFRRYLICGLWKEFMPFISSIQGWVNQPSITELENLLSNQEALMKQILAATRNLSLKCRMLFIQKTKQKAIIFPSILHMTASSPKLKGSLEVIQKVVVGVESQDT